MSDFRDLINACIDKGMKHEEIAQVMGVSRTAVLGYLSGNIHPAPVRVELLARYVGASLSEYDPAKIDCGMHAYDKNGKHGCRGLKYCQCAFGEECNFYKPGPIEGPDPLYDAAPPSRRPIKKIPQEKVDEAVILRDQGLMWSEVAERVGWDCNALRNRVSADRRKAAGKKRKKPAS